MPSVFDATYTYALGATAAALVFKRQTGLIASVRNLSAPVVEWACGGAAVTTLVHLERRKGKEKPVIRKALVELTGPYSTPYRALKAVRDGWAT